MEKKFTLAQVARKMGIAHALVRSWEAGIRQPDHVQLAHLKHVLDMQFDIK
jgi:transcriptional regulator with XRE-family HTH domain